MTTRGLIIQVNLGCGQSPTPGWTNFDNSPTVRLARSPFRYLLHDKTEYLALVRRFDIRYAEATRLPLGTSEVTTLYSSHMLEHLDRLEVLEFLKEAHRVLIPGGILRLAVPDLAGLVEQYRVTGDADHFFASLSTPVSKPRGWKQKMKYALFTGFREHYWMYDASSLKSLLQENGFVHAVALEAGQTTIANPGALYLCERAQESLYIEAARDDGVS